MIPGWLIASWRLIKIVSVAPLVFLLFSWKMLPESPRWLISKSRTKEASKILTKIAETNGVRPPADLTPRLEKIAEANKETSLGYLRCHYRYIIEGAISWISDDITFPPVCLERQSCAHEQ